MSTEKRTTGNIALYVVGIIVLVGIGLGVLTLMASKDKSLANEASKRDADVKAGPFIKVATVVNSGTGRSFTVIGELRPYQSVTLYAKLSGFVKHIDVDKGQAVKEGQVMATIESPETDQDYASALADAANKKVIMERDKDLFQKNYVSKEQAELSETTWKIADAKVKSLKAMLDYKIVRAPFNGTVTARFADNGALLQNAANSQGGAQAVVTVAQLNKLRLYAYVDQRDAGYAKAGYPVTISLQEKPEVKLNTKITRVAGELDPKTRMMLVEVEVDNSKNDWVPGSFVSVTIQAPTATNGVPVVPIEALVVRKDKYFVPKLNADSTIHYQEIKIKENTGEKILVADGLQVGDVVALNLGETVSEGGKVKIAKP